MIVLVGDSEMVLVIGEIGEGSKDCGSCWECWETSENSEIIAGGEDLKPLIGDTLSLRVSIGRTEFGLKDIGGVVGNLKQVVEPGGQKLTNRLRMMMSR